MIPVSALPDMRRSVARLGGWVSALSATMMLVLILSQAQYYRLGASIAFLLSGGATLWLLARERDEAAYRVLILGCWLGTMIGLATTNGIRSNLVAVLPLVLVFTAWLVGRRALLYLGAATVVALLGMAVADAHGALPIGYTPPLAQQAFVLVLVIVSAVAMGHRAAHAFQRQIDLADASKRSLEEKVDSLARREEELRLIAENVPAMIARFGCDEVCRFANTAYARFAGRPIGAVVGHKAVDIIGESAFEAIKPAVLQALSGRTARLTVIRRNADGEARTLATELVPDFTRSGTIDGWYALIRDITDSERASNALRHIVEGTARATGAEFFRALVRNLAQATGLRNGMVAEVLPGGDRARTLAYWNGSEFCDPATYVLAGAPCRHVLEDGAACYPDRVAELFPDDRPLAAQGIRGYYGVRLDASDGSPLGLLVVMDGAPLYNHEELASLVSVFAARAAGEIERSRTETALALSSERFSKVFDCSPLPIVITHLTDGSHVDANPAYTATFGWTRDEVRGRSALEFGSWPSPAARQRWVTELAARRRTRDYETTLQNKAGEKLSILISAEIIELEGQPHIIAFMHDQTQRQRLELAKHAALQRFEAIFQNVPNVAIKGFDVDGAILHWNRASERMYGIAAVNAIGKSVRTLFLASDNVGDFEAAVSAVRASGLPTEPVERPIVQPDGRTAWALSIMLPVFVDNDLVEIFCMEVDITDMKCAAEEVRRLNVDLEARVAARTAELAALNRELEAFSYSVSHDLRAPLRSIDGFGHLLEQDCADRLDDAGKDYVSRMRRAAQRLARLIDDLLDLTRINRARIRPEDVDLSALAREIVDELRQSAPQRNVAVAIEDGLRVHGDPLLLRIALQNLLDNAWKYTAKTDSARVDFGCDLTTGQPAYFVRDNGAGFDIAYADKLFTPFQRLHNPRDFEGTGVGLASVARVVKRHDGRIWADAEPGKGATFWFTLASPSGADA